MTTVPDASPPSASPLKKGAARGLTGEVIRYILVAGTTYAADLLVYLAFVMASPTWYLQGNVAGRLFGASLGFILHKRWTFGGMHRRSTRTQAISYGLLLSFNIGLSSALLMALQSWLPGLGPLLWRGITDVLVISFTFFCSKHIFQGQYPATDTAPSASNQTKAAPHE